MNHQQPHLSLAAAARLPAPLDNVAIATRRLEAGTIVDHDGSALSLPHTVMEGHRFAVERIAAGAVLLSWGLPFGTAIRDIAPGEYICNERILATLPDRGIDFELPPSANFTDRLERFAFDESTFRAGRQIAPVAAPGTFDGYRRPGGRGVGTRNHIVVLATTSRANAYASALTKRFADGEWDATNCDGVVAVTHTEGATGPDQHNLDLVLRTLSGFMAHPNVGAVLAVDYPGDGYGNAELKAFVAQRGEAFGHVTHEFLTIERDFSSELERAASIIAGWIPGVAGAQRTKQPLSELRVALQCGGSDAFSGVSGNALAGWVAKLLIQHGGSANVAETDELMGAEEYVLRNVRNLATARRLLEVIERFKVRMRHHGATPEGNPSGGNNYRGLYNIALKSLGAARKFDPEVRLDHVIEYAQPMVEPGCYYMDSPGNDLESIAGQVAAGCNLVFFTTGNGSITNFPFVPTLKFVTTTGRFEMLADEMDVNAGRYNDGESMADLGDEVFGLARRVASGERSKGERAGHSQVQIWRDWQQVDDRQLIRLQRSEAPDARPLRARSAEPSRIRFKGLKSRAGVSTDRVGLVMPTSLCSGQIARLIVDELNARAPHASAARRYVALVHTEGCGSVNTLDVFLQTLLGHLRHPSVDRALLLEHGCEMTHNDAVRTYMQAQGVDPERYGWASIQLDGGIRNVGARVRRWFEGQPGEETSQAGVVADAASLAIGLLADGPVSDHAATALAGLARGIVAAGGTIVVPSSGPLSENDVFHDGILAPDEHWRTTLAYGQPFDRGGLHVMDAPTTHATETVTGLGGTGVQVLLGHVASFPLQGHPMIPMLQIGGTSSAVQQFAADLDLLISADEPAGSVILELERLIAATASREYEPSSAEAGATDFQMTRGHLGVSV